MRTLGIGMVFSVILVGFCLDFWAWHSVQAAHAAQFASAALPTAALTNSTPPNGTVEAQGLIKDLKALKARVESTRQSISDEALAVMSPKLAAIANYGMNMASFATSSWNSMSFEDQKRSCEEALAAIDGAGLGDRLP
jgi:hypothetical protein